MVDRHDDELAERRASTRPKRERAAGGGALPLQWADPPEEPIVDDGLPVLDVGEEADSDVAPGGPVAEDGDTSPGVRGAPGNNGGETIDLTGRAQRGRGDDLEVWSDVLRRRPAEAARLTGHPSAAGERIAAAAARRRQPAQPPQPEGVDEDGGATAPADSVSRLRPVPEPPEPSKGKGSGSELATRVITGVVMAAGGLLVLNSGPGPASVLVGVIGRWASSSCAERSAPRATGRRCSSPCSDRWASCWAPTTAASPPSRRCPLSSSRSRCSGTWPAWPGPARRRGGLHAPGLRLRRGHGGFAGLVLAQQDGIGLLLGVVLCNAAYDIGGYLAGSRFGRRHTPRRSRPTRRRKASWPEWPLRW